MTAVKEGPIVGKISLKSQGGTISAGEPEGFRWPTISSTKDKVTGSNISKNTEHGAETEGSIAGGEISALADVTLSMKNLRKSSH